MEQPNRPARKVAIADHIWDAFEEMAREMGTDRDGLVNQAMFMFARLNGFLDGWRFTNRNEVVPVSQPVRAPVQILQPVDGLAERVMDGAPRPIEQEPPRREAQRFKSEGKGKDGMAASPPLERQELLGDDQADGPGAEPREERSEEPEVSALPVQASGSGLYIITDAGEERVAKPRYIIGRGKHCDLVINSGKVSREHASIFQEGEDWYIEDLGSSNGTWFDKQRIKRRKIEDGDEYFVCSERIGFAFR